MIEALAYALACGVALSAVLVPAVGLAIRCAPAFTGAVRHTLWLMVLLATVAASCAAFVVSIVRPVHIASGSALAGPDAFGPVHSTDATIALGLPLLACWLVVAAVRMLLIVRRAHALRVMKLRAMPIDVAFELPRGARALAADIEAPSAVGFLHPAVLLPAAAIGRLDPRSMRQIVLHEAAHLRRRDDVTNLAFLMCAAVFWFNPFVHAIGKKLSLECEIACDEIVVGETQDPARYAALLYEFAQNIVVGRPHLVWSGFVHPSGLVVRIKNVLLERDARRRTLPVPVLVILIGALLTGVGVAAFNAPALGRAANDGSLRLRAVDLRFELENGAAARRVRDFVPCGVRGGSHARTAPGTGRHREVCEDTSGRSARMTTRVAPDTTIR